MGVVLMTYDSIAQADMDQTPNTNCTGVQTGCTYNGPSILINEICISPSNYNGSLITGSSFDQFELYGEGEWIELYNPDECDSIDISGYMLGSYNGEGGGGGASEGMGFILPQGTVVPPNGFVVVRGRRAPQPDANAIDIVVTEQNQNLCWTGGANSRFWFADAGSWFAFYDRNGVPQDAISWGRPQAGDLSESPCIPADHLFGGNVSSVPGYQQTGVGRRLGATREGYSFVRIPDGGSWSTTMAHEFTSIGSCNGSGKCQNGLGSSTCNGTATVNPNFGVAPYRFEWDDVLEQTTATAIKLCAGEYTVVVTDAAGTQQTFTVIIEDDFFQLDSLVVDQPNCRTLYGESEVFVSGKAPDNRFYNYKWQPDVSSTSKADRLTQGLYRVLIDDGYCLVDTSFYITDGRIDFAPNPDQIAGCDTLTVTFNNQSTGVAQGTSTCHWDFGDGQTSTECQPTHFYAQPGFYTVTLSITDDQNCTDAFSYSSLIAVRASPAIDLGPDSTWCGNVLESFAVEGDFIYYHWQPGGETTQRITTVPVGELSVEVVDRYGCSGRDTIHLIPLPYPHVELGPDTTFCEGGQAVFSADPHQVSILWSDGSSNEQVVIDSTAEVSVTVTNSLDCFDRDTVNVWEVPYPSVVRILRDTLACMGDQEQIQLESDAAFFLWSNGATTKDIAVKAGDRYAVFAYNELNAVECGLSDSLSLTWQPYPVEVHPDSFLYCFEWGDSIEIYATINAAFYDWGEGNTSRNGGNHQWATHPGFYTVSTYDYPNCQLVQHIPVDEKCPLRLHVPTAFTPDGDGLNDYFMPVSPNHTAIHFEIYDRWGELLFEGRSIHDAWDGTFKGNPVQEGVYIWKCTAEGYDLNNYVKTIAEMGTVTVVR